MNLPKPVPVVLSFPEEAARQDAWGRLRALAGIEACVETRAKIAKGERLFLSFDLPGGDNFKDIPARARKVGVDADGYLVVQVDFLDEVHKKKLGRVVGRLLSTQ